MHVPHTHSTDFKGKLPCMFYQKIKKLHTKPGYIHSLACFDRERASIKMELWSSQHYLGVEREQLGCVWWLANEPIDNLIVGFECVWHFVSRLHTGGRLYGWIGVWSTVNFHSHTLTGANEFFLFVRIWRSNLKQQRLQAEWLEHVKKHYVCKSILLHQSWTYLWI